LVKVKAGRWLGRLEVQEDSLVVGRRYLVAVGNAGTSNAKPLDLEQAASVRSYNTINDSGQRYLVA
tara:strand:+ start:82 stop:279 length:198 start_codon:yes stop_codon:yes gene_type:complete